MTCRVDRVHSLDGLVLRISGRIAAEDMEVVRAALDEDGVVAIELSEIELIDRDAVHLLAAAEAGGVELRRCPAYIREWITRERNLEQGEPT
jgi:hypothetical protein